MNKKIKFCMIFLFLFFLGKDCFGQSVYTRTVNLESELPSEKGTIYFDYTHRFIISSAPVSKVLNYPTFTLAYGLLDDAEVKARYATNSSVVAGQSNEFEIAAKYRFTKVLAQGDIGIAIMPAYNVSVNSLDGVVPVEWFFLKDFKAVINAAWLGDSAVSKRFEVLFGAGLIYFLDEKTSIAVDARQTIKDGVWSAGINYIIPYSPHTISLHVSNAESSTIQGSCFKANALRYGFEFTIRH